jgi:hypothetical protein
VHWQVLFLDFDRFVVKLFSAYKDLSLLKFGSGDFIFSPCWNYRLCYTKNHDYFYVYFHIFTLFINVLL